MANDIWSLISPFVAASTAVLLARRQDRERVSCFVDWSFEIGDQEGPYNFLYIGIHNRSPHKIAIRSVKLLSGGFARVATEGTALSYEDPFDLNFPYKVEPGEVKTLALDEEAATKLFASSSRCMNVINKILRRPRIMVECMTTAGTRFRGSAEEALPWDERQRWARL